MSVDAVYQQRNNINIYCVQSLIYFAISTDQVVLATQTLCYSRQRTQDNKCWQKPKHTQKIVTEKAASFHKCVVSKLPRNCINNPTQINTELKFKTQWAVMFKRMFHQNKILQKKTRTQVFMHRENKSQNIFLRWIKCRLLSQEDMIGIQSKTDKVHFDKFYFYRTLRRIFSRKYCVLVLHKWTLVNFDQEDIGIQSKTDKVYFDKLYFYRNLKRIFSRKYFVGVLPKVNTCQFRLIEISITIIENWFGPLWEYNLYIYLVLTKWPCSFR